MEISIKDRLKLIGLTTNKAMFDYELETYAKKMRIKNFRGIYDRQALPTQPKKKEAIIVNLDDISQPGTHWVALRKINDNAAIYFDSYGNLPPPQEILSYANSCLIYYNSTNFQGKYKNICGQLCLEFLINTG